MKTLHNGMMWTHIKSDLHNLTAFEHDESFTLIPFSEVERYIEAYPTGKQIEIRQCEKSIATFEALFSFYNGSTPEHVFFKKVIL